MTAETEGELDLQKVKGLVYTLLRDAGHDTSMMYAPTVNRMSDVQVIGAVAAVFDAKGVRTAPYFEALNAHLRSGDGKFPLDTGALGDLRVLSLDGLRRYLDEVARGISWEH